MKTAWIHLLSILVVLTLGTGAYTGSFFSDAEGAPANHLTSSLLDDVLLGDPLDGLVCEIESPLTTTIEVEAGGTYPHTIELAVSEATDDYCNALDGELILENSTIYDGPLAGLMSGTFELAIGETLAFTLNVRPTEGILMTGSCSFNTVLTSYQTGLEGGGFSDVETISHTVFRDAMECGDTPDTSTSTVNLYLNKHISGETLGYEESDFSYRVTGEGIDVLVPHDHTTPVPVGTYTIEEIVPEGFVKEDWRIGWYGQCERGSAYTTSITIEERDLEKETLYCEADNQYRPDTRSRESGSTESGEEETQETEVLEEDLEVS